MIFQRANNLNRKIYCSDPRCAKISGCFFFARGRGIVNFLKFQSPPLVSHFKTLVWQGFSFNHLTALSISSKSFLFFSLRLCLVRGFLRATQLMAVRLSE